jgi:1-deoxy-D-xylulose-5-phosphate reductoisomerase
MSQGPHNICILGATGTIGINTLDVIERHPQRFRAYALSANNNFKRMAELVSRHQPRYAVMADDSAAQALQEVLGDASGDTEILSGVAALEQIAAHDDVDAVMAGIVGAAGLMPTLAAARAGKRVMLANKESLVMSGQLFMDVVRENGAELLPIDSEHNAIFQCMPAGYEEGLPAQGIERILLTASGGPFRTMAPDELATVTPEQACAHPNWVMGRKISVDSASMMNKGLEVIEACWLFNTDSDSIQVVIHPQSVIHSMVAYNDGSVLAQLGNPDMRTPIAYALGWPERIDAGVESLNLFDIAHMDFEQPDLSRFPCLRLAYEAYQAGGTATTILNAANEEAVASFLDKKIPFTEIPAVIEGCLEDISTQTADTLEVIMAADQAAREQAQTRIRQSQGVA